MLQKERDTPLGSRSKKSNKNDSLSNTQQTEQTDNEEVHVPTTSTSANIKNITDDIRSRVHKWGKKMNLVESEQFTVIVKNDISGSSKMCVSIRCGCGKKCVVNQKDENWMISNWTRHYLSCGYAKDKK